MKYCIHCGAPVEDNAKFCTECGGKQELQDQPDSAAGSAYTGGNNASYTGGNSQPYTGGSNAAYNGGNSQQYTGGIPNYTAQPFTPFQSKSAPGVTESNFPAGTSVFLYLRMLSVICI